MASYPSIFPCRSVELPCQPMDVSVQGHLVACGLIDGRVALLRIPDAAAGGGGKAVPAPRCMIWRAHRSSCRSAVFLDGALASGDASGTISLSSITRGKRISKYGGIDEDVQADPQAANGRGVNCMLALDGSHTFAVGYDSGIVRVFDRRTLLKAKRAVASFAAHTDFVSDMDVAMNGRHVVTTSGDGTLAVHDVRASKRIARSEDDADDEMLSVKVVKGGKKVVCGHQGGVIDIYSWGYWNDCSDRFPGHPGPVDTLAKVDEDTVLTGSFDGLVRIVSIQPNRAIGIVGEHAAEYPIEQLDLDPITRILASVSHDSVCKVWSVDALFEEDSGRDDRGRGDGEGATTEDAGALEANAHGDGGNRVTGRKRAKEGKDLLRDVAKSSRSAFFADM